jgi:uroporphyrinogen-III synthase
MTNTLKHLRILVTRSPEQASGLSRKLKSRGATTFEVPVISIGPPSSWSDVDKCLDKINQYDWIIFASANAVHYLILRIVERGQSPSILSSCKIACIGSSTLQCLDEHGLIAAFCPTRFVAESLIQEFPGYPHLEGQQFFWPRTNIGRDYIAEQLTAASARVDCAVTYITSEPANRAEIQRQLTELIRNRNVDIITLASAQAARNLASLYDSEIPEEIKIVTIGPETSRAAAESFGRYDLQADPHTMDGIVETIETQLLAR